ncbi:MAG: mechanosensitive ion channel [archaeon]|nr:mechanosensitive ion channel [archaeon]MCP8316830.1 mechanosensitive ion channel [archaeon]MCP8319334.1 mechanosensitive ion channel [archaeon]
MVDITSYQIIASVVILSSLAILILVIKWVMNKRLRKLAGYQKFFYFLGIMLTLSIVAFLAYIWGVFSIVIGTLTTAGVIGLIIALALLPWLTDAIVGISLYLDRSINIDDEVEIAGKVGRIAEIRLTTTKIVGEGYVLIVPNRKFREEIIKVKIV